LVSINISKKTGEQKTPVAEIECRADSGLVGDAHAGPWHRQVSLLAEESMAKMCTAELRLSPGDFAENLTVRGLDLLALPIGAKLKIGAVLLEVTQIGKECHGGCVIRQLTGDCVMPREGIFTRVLTGGTLTAGLPIVRVFED